MRPLEIETVTWWLNDRNIFPWLVLCEGDPPYTGGFSSQKTSNAELWCTVEQRLTKQGSCRWSETPKRSYDVTLTETSRMTRGIPCIAWQWCERSVQQIGFLVDKTSNISIIAKQVVTFDTYIRYIFFFYTAICNRWRWGGFHETILNSRTCFFKTHLPLMPHICDSELGHH